MCAADSDNDNIIFFFNQTHKIICSCCKFIGFEISVFWNELLRIKIIQMKIDIFLDQVLLTNYL